MHEVSILKCLFYAKKGLFGALASITNPMKLGTYSRNCKQGTGTRVCISEYAIREYPGYVKAFCGSTPPPKTFQIMADDSSEQAGACSLPFAPALVLSLPLSSSPFLLPPSSFSLSLFLLSSSRSSSLSLFLSLPLSSSLPPLRVFFSLQLCSSLPQTPALFLSSSRSSSVPVSSRSHSVSVFLLLPLSSSLPPPSYSL